MSLRPAQHLASPYSLINGRRFAQVLVWKGCCFAMLMQGLNQTMKQPQLSRLHPYMTTLQRVADNSSADLGVTAHDMHACQEALHLSSTA